MGQVPTSSLDETIAGPATAAPTDMPSGSSVDMTMVSPGAAAKAIADAAAGRAAGDPAAPTGEVDSDGSGGGETTDGRGGRDTKDDRGAAEAKVRRGGLDSAAARAGAFPAIKGYEVLRAIGRGGMGIVYEASQQSTGRRVALKFMLDAAAMVPEGRRRFEREVELVARLQHPNITAILDSGVHQGQYYFIMEFVSGVRLDAYVKGTARAPIDDEVSLSRGRAPSPRAGMPAGGGPSGRATTSTGTTARGHEPPLDANGLPERLGVSQTLRLIATICDAVDYAHQRGVLHRDLKPSNILIDGRGEPHILDFGLAKSIDPNREEGLDITLSAPGQLLGTLGYMSPEQGRGEAEHMSVRSDVYSIGVMAYELVTNKLPCSPIGPLHEVLTRIANLDPPRPSTLLARLSADVDAIIMKALEKAPTDRYATPGEMAADIRRFLSDEPVMARPIGTAVRLGRWVRRNRALSAVIIGAAMLLVVITTVSFMRIRAERDHARDSATAAREAMGYVEQIVSSLNPEKARRPDISIRGYLDDIAEGLRNAPTGQPEGRAAVHSAIGNTYKKLGRFQEAVTHLSEALKIRQTVLPDPNPDVARSMHDLAAALWESGEYVRAEDLYRRSLALKKELYGEDSVEFANTLTHLAACRRRQGDVNGAEDSYRKVLEVRRKVLGPTHDEVAASMNNLAKCLMDQGKYDEAEGLLRLALEITEGRWGKPHPNVATAMLNLATCLRNKSRFDEADLLLQETLAMRRKLYGEDNKGVAFARVELARLMLQRNQPENAEKECLAALEVQRRNLKADHPDTQETLRLLAQICRDAGRTADAQKWADEEMRNKAASASQPN